MSSPEHNTRSSDRGGYRHSLSDSNQVDLHSAVYFHPNGDGGFQDVSLMPWSTQIPYVRFGDPYSQRMSIGADFWSDFPHAPRGAASVASFTTNAIQLQQPLQMPETSVFQAVEKGKVGAVTTSLQHCSQGRRDHQQRTAKPGGSQQHGQPSRGTRWPPQATTSCLLGGVDSRSAAQAPLSSSTTASIFGRGRSCGSGACAGFIGGIFGAAVCGDGGFAAAAEATSNGSGVRESSQQKLTHQSSNRGSSSTVGDSSGNAITVGESEYVMVRPQFFQMLLQQYQQQQNTTPLSEFMHSAPPKSKELGGLIDLPAAGSAATTNAINAHLLHLLSGSGGTSAGHMIPTSSLQPQSQLFASSSLLSHSPSTGLSSRASQISSAIKSDNGPALQWIGTPGTYIVYPEARKQGTTAATAAASNSGSGKARGNAAAVLPESLEQSGPNICHFASSPPPTAPTNESNSGAHANSPASAASLVSLNALFNSFGPESHSVAATMPKPSSGKYPPFTGPTPHRPPGLPTLQQPPSPPPRTKSARSHPIVKPASRAGNVHGGQGSVTAPPTGSNSTSSAGNGHGGSRRQQGGSGDHANSQGGAAAHTCAGSAHAQPKNGANFVVGAWYEGVVKRYNPLRGFGFLTCTHRLSIDFHACEKACTRHADAVQEEQQTREREKAAAAATSGKCAPLQGAEEDALVQGEQKRQQTLLTHESAPHADDPSTAPFLASNQLVKESDVGVPHDSVAVDAFHEGGNGAVAPVASTGEKAENADVTATPVTEVTSTGKAHGAVVYSTMQWYLHKVVAAEKEASAEDAVASPEADESTGGGELSCRPPFAEFGKLERQPAQLGDIFVHHSCISMDGFRVFVPGIAVRFSVAVLMDTVQAVDVIPLGPEWEKPLSPEALAQPPLYKVTPTAATVLRYHRLTAQSDGGSAKENGGGPQSRVGSGPVQWTDMAVIPSPAIPNSIEGQSELFVVRVPPKTGPVSSEMIVGPWEAGPAEDPVTTNSSPATTGPVKDGADTLQSTSTTEHEIVRRGSIVAVDAEVRDTRVEALTCTGPAEALHSVSLSMEVVHPESITVAFQAMTGEDQRALQGEPGTPAITPTSSPAAKEPSNFNETSMATKKWSMPTAEELECRASCMSLEKVLNTNLNGDPTVFCSGGLRSSKVDQASSYRSRDAGMTSTTTTNLALSSDHNTISHILALGSSQRDMRSIGGDVSGDCKDLVFSCDTDEHPFSYGRGVGQRAEKAPHAGNREEAAGVPAAAVDRDNATVSARTGLAADKSHQSYIHHDYERRAGGAATAGLGATRAKPNGDSLGTRPHENTGSMGALVHPHGSCGSDEGEKDPIPATSTTSSGNMMSDSYPGLAPDWTEVFDLKMASERAKDIMMHKIDLKFFPHHCAKSTAVAAASGPKQRSGGGAGTVALVPKVVPLSAVGELANGSSPDVQEDEDIVEASDSHSATGHRHDRGESDSYEVNPSSPQLPTSGDNSEQTGTTQLAPDESSSDSCEARPRAGKPKKGDGAHGQQKRLKDPTMPSLVMVEVASLPPELAAQVPPSVAIIALPRHTLKGLKIESIPVARDTSSSPASPCCAEVQATTPAVGGPPAPDSRARPNFYGSAEAAGGCSTSSALAAQKAGGDLQAQNDVENAGSVESELFRSLLVAAGNKTASSSSPSPLSRGKGGLSRSPEGDRIALPLTLVSTKEQQVSQPPRGASMERGSGSEVTKSSGRSIATCGTTSFLSVPMPQSLVNNPPPPWLDEKAVSSQFPHFPQEQPPQQSMQHSTPTGSQLTPVDPTPRDVMKSSASQQELGPWNPVFMSLNGTAALRAASWNATGSLTSPGNNSLYLSPPTCADDDTGSARQPPIWAPSLSPAPAHHTRHTPPPSTSSVAPVAPTTIPMPDPPQAGSRGSWAQV
ncbi:hypothetical protein LSCM4_03220 [Leishmania orientalis]|uniref:CSD domain-containing protein n=1 Tax=Leishmania orientalis TaxID=2249476 RepID=A0A836KMX7_9TRYP|nr:hypothetical protein LSCM4_03220 [Leishmania orientalis]